MLNHCCDERSFYHIFSVSNRTDRTTAVAIAGAVHERTTAVQDEVVGGVRVVRNRAPITTISATSAIECTSVPISCFWNKDTIAIYSCYLISFNVILLCPFPIAVINKFLHFIFCRNSPAFSPVGSSCIVLNISADVIYLFTVCQTICFCIFVFGFCLSPCEIATAGFWR